MLGALQRGNTQLQVNNGWRHLAVWIRMRDILVAIYLVLFLHDLLIRITGYAILPMLTGLRLPPLPYYDVALFLLVVLITWRLLADHGWLAKLYRKEISFMFAGLLVILAAGLIHGLVLIQVLMLKGLVYPLVVFLVAYCLGINLRKGMQFLAVVGLINLAAGLIIFIFFIDSYRDLLLVLEMIMPETSQGLTGVSTRHASILIPYGLLIRRNMYADFFILTTSVSLFAALNPLVSKRWRSIAAVCFGVGALLVLVSFSRTALLSCALVSIVIACHRFISNHRSQDRALRRQSAVMLLSLFGAGSSILLITLVTNAFLGGELFQLASLTDMEIGRFAYWNRVIFALNSQHGWLFGLSSLYSSGDSMIAGMASEQIWTERQVSTFDNAYLYILALTGLVGLAGYLLYLGGMLKLLLRYKLALPLCLLTGVLLVSQVFVSVPLFATMVFFLAGSMAGNVVQGNSNSTAKTSC